jgi:hypothetical protein
MRREGSGQHPSPRFFNFNWESNEDIEERGEDPLHGWEPEWNWQSCGFQWGVFQLRGQTVQLRNVEDGSAGRTIWFVSDEIAIAAIPYWSLVVPLALLSAYLILIPSSK